MNTDIRIAVSFLGHRKRRKLRMLLGVGSTDCLLDLWIQTAMNHPDGVLRGMDEVDIALEAGWEGDPGQFVEAMRTAGFLDLTEEGWKLHDWEEHQPWVTKAEERTAQARKAADARWAKVRQAAPGYAPGSEPESEKDAGPRPCAGEGPARGMRSAGPQQCPFPLLSSPEEEKAEEEDSLRSSSCAELLADSRPEDSRTGRTGRTGLVAMVCGLPLNDGSEHEIGRDFVEQMARLYPAVDVIQELKRMKGWLIGNPKNRKTRRGIAKFVTSWLDREQNKARASPGSLLAAKQPVPGTYAQAQDAEKRATALRILERSRQHGNLAEHRGHGGAALDTAAQLPERA
ncbi:hypothetical protein [Desulfocurvibacter africanus]|nr:hypothetical protein [Desulfocurvibacter africanus]